MSSFLQDLTPAVPQWLRGLPGSFTVFDWLVIVVAGWSLVRGFLRGVIRELFGIAGLLLGLATAAWYYPMVAALLTRVLPSPAGRDAVAFLAVAFAVVSATSLLGRLIRSAAHMAGLGLLDRLAGGLFGVARACLFGAVILMPLTAFLPPLPAIRQSRLAPILLEIAHATSALAPSSLRHRIAQGVAAFRASSSFQPPSRHSGLDQTPRIGNNGS